MIPTLRTMTLKSKLGFGKYKDLTVQKIIDIPLPLVLISAYYKLTSINYNEEVLGMLGITKDYQIKKPGTDGSVYINFLNKKGYKKKLRGEGSDKLKKQTKDLSRGNLQNKNQGHN